jgi:fimbrial chaperone protein
LQSKACHGWAKRLQANGLLWALALALALFSPIAWATGATSISPISINVPASGRAIVTVHNDHAREILYQISVLSWQVVDGVDVYQDTPDFIASPPIFELEPQGSQVVRIGRRNPVHQSVEQAYRLVIKEVPRPGSTAERTGVVNFALQYLVPVFVVPTPGVETPPLTWSLRQEGDTVVVRAHNPGLRHKAFDGVGLSRGPELAGAKPGQPVHVAEAQPEPEWVIRQRVTVLARSWREWRFQVPNDADSDAGAGAGAGASPAVAPWRILALPNGNAPAVLIPVANMRPFPSP